MSRYEVAHLYIKYQNASNPSKTRYLALSHAKSWWLLQILKYTRLIIARVALTPHQQTASASKLRY